MQIFRFSTACIKIDQILSVSFPLNFVSLFSAMTHNFSEIFHLKNYIALDINEQVFRFLSGLTKVHLIPHAIFEITRPGFIQILYHCPVP